MMKVQETDLLKPHLIIAVARLQMTYKGYSDPSTRMRPIGILDN